MDGELRPISKQQHEKPDHPFQEYRKVEELRRAFWTAVQAVGYELSQHHFQKTAHLADATDPRDASYGVSLMLRWSTPGELPSISVESNQSKPFRVVYRTTLNNLLHAWLCFEDSEYIQLGKHTLPGRSETRNDVKNRTKKSRLLRVSGLNLYQTLPQELYISGKFTEIVEMFTEYLLDDLTMLQRERLGLEEIIEQRLAALKTR